MSKTHQFRCWNCGRLLLKWLEGTETCEYQAPGIEFKITDKVLRVKCTKETCGKVNKRYLNTLVRDE